MRTLRSSYTHWGQVLLKWWVWDLNPGTLCSSPLTYEASYLLILDLTQYMQESEHHHSASKDTKGMYLPNVMEWLGFPGGTRSKEPACQWRRRERCRFDPWSGRIPWRRAQQPTAVFSPGESCAQRSLVGCSPQGRTESDMTEAT